MTEHGLEYDKIVLCNLAQLSQLDRVKLQKTATGLGATVEAHHVFDRDFVASRLRRDGEWRSRLLGLSADPVTLARKPADLVESPWAHIGFVGRDVEVAQLVAQPGDSILTGLPGVGKSRLLTEVPGILFVDRDAAFGQLADDIRWLGPKVLAIDDAGAADQLLRRLVRLRQLEPDLAQYRIVAVCWPDEVEAVLVNLPGADVVELPLLERSDVDTIIQSMGVERELARAEILDQAEGRPGWAVALADLLVSGDDAASLLNGRALLGEVERYIRRSGPASETVVLLALTAALGGVREDELGELASDLGLTRAEVSLALRQVAHSGLIDVVTSHDWIESRAVRTYFVRPPMLARALVAEQVFKASAAILDLEDVADRWPNRVAALAEAASFSALFEAPGAREVAGRLFVRAIASDDVTPQEKLELCNTYVLLDDAAGAAVLEMISPELDAVYSTDAQSNRQADHLVDLVKRIARRHAGGDAFRILLDAAARDARATNQHSSHPTRALDDLVHEFHPELPLPAKNRSVLAATLDGWLDAEPVDEERWRVFGEQAANLLSFELGSAYTSPGDPHSFQLVRTIVRPEEMTRIYDDIWPSIRKRLESAPPAVVAEVVDAAVDWLRIGAGVGAAFGGSYPEDVMAAAAALGASIVQDLADVVSRQPGLVARLLAATHWIDTAIEIESSDANQAFYVDVERGGDWEASAASLEAGIREVVVGWKGDARSEVIQRLADIDEQLDVAGLKWPNRIRIAFAIISETLGTRSDWIEAALENSMFPDASPLMADAVEAGEILAPEIWQRCWQQPGARWEALRLAFTGEVAAPVAEAALAELGPQDFTMIEHMIIRAELTEQALRELLTKTSQSTRGAVAAAMFTGSRNSDPWTAGALDEEWLSAMPALNFDETGGLNTWHVGELFKAIVESHPDVLLTLVKNRLAGAATGGAYASLPSDAWESLHLLPSAHKTALWLEFGEKEGFGWMLRQYLIGSDVSWLEIMLEEGHFDEKDALGGYSAFGPHLEIEDLARILIPRGTDPKQIAGLAVSGTWSGEASSRYAALTERFEAMAKSEDPPVAAVGIAGQEIYSTLRDTALTDERRKRIRGEI